jgi:hypothetical protein
MGDGPGAPEDAEAAERSGIPYSACATVAAVTVR